MGITISKSFALSTCVLFISHMQLVNGAQFLNTTPLSLSSACLAAASAHLPVVAIFSLTKIYASL